MDLFFSFMYFVFLSPDLSLPPEVFPFSIDRFEMLFELGNDILPVSLFLLWKLMRVEDDEEFILGNLVFSKLML